MTLILFVPGYVIGWVSGIFEFRQRRLITRCALSTPLAVSVLPILVYRFGHYPRLLWAAFAAFWLCFLFILIRELPRCKPALPLRLPTSVWVTGALIGLWAVFATIGLVDLEFRGHLYYSIAAHDYSLRTAFTAAAVRQIPPANPFFAASPPVPLRYHYFWMLICGLVTRLSGVGPRQALYGGTVWAGIVLLSFIAISFKFFLQVRERLERKIVVAYFLLLVTGLDILPTLYLYLHYHVVSPEMEWWNEEIASWLANALYGPHQLMSLVGCMMGLFLLREPVSKISERSVAVIVAALAFASALGLSVMVTFTFVVFVLLWLPYALLKRWWDDVLGFGAAGGLALLAALPYIHTLLAPALDGSGGSGRFLQVSTRGFWIGIDFLAWLLHRPPDSLAYLTLPLLPVNYFVELGFFFVIGVLRAISIRRGVTPMTRTEETAWIMIVTSFLIGSFLRSTTINSNDLGWHCFLQTQLVLLLWAALLAEKWWQNWSQSVKREKKLFVLLSSLAILGVIGTTYQFAMLRVFPILYDRGMVRPMNRKIADWLEDDRQIGVRTFALRSIYDQLSIRLRPDAVVQYNPLTPAFIPHEAYSLHFAAMGLPQCGAVFGGDLEKCKPRMETIPPLFDHPSEQQYSELDENCRQNGIDVLVVDDDDPVWRVKQSWVWTRPPLIANERARAFSCGSEAYRGSPTRLSTSFPSGEDTFSSFLP